MVKKKTTKKKTTKKERGKNLRLPSGIKGLDNLIDNGFEPKSINMIVGDSGSGKTIFAMQYLMGGLKNKENCLFITFEENKEEFYSNMKKFGWDLDKYEKEGLFHFLEYSPEKVNSMLGQGGGEIEDIVVNEKISRIVVDSITSFALLFDNDLEKREAALSLFNIIRKWGVTCLLTLQENPLKRDSERASELEFESDSIILIYFVRDGNQRKRFLEILKMRGTRHATEIYEVNLNAKTGIEITKKTHKNGFSS